MHVDRSHVDLPLASACLQSPHAISGEDRLRFSWFAQTCVTVAKRDWITRPVGTAFIVISHQKAGKAQPAWTKIIRSSRRRRQAKTNIKRSLQTKINQQVLTCCQDLQPWVALPSVRNSTKLVRDSLLTIKVRCRLGTAPFSAKLWTEGWPCAQRLSPAANHFHRFQWEHEYLSVFPQWSWWIMSPSAAFLSSCSRSWDCIMHHPLIIMAPIYLLWGDHVTYSDRTMRDWIFIASNCSCNWFPCVTWASPCGF